MQDTILITATTDTEETFPLFPLTQASVIPTFVASTVKTILVFPLLSCSQTANFALLRVDCLAFIWRRDHWHCWLKNQLNGLSDCPACVLGYRPT